MGRHGAGQAERRVRTWEEEEEAAAPAKNRARRLRKRGLMRGGETEEALT